MYFQKPVALTKKNKKAGKLKMIQDYRLNEPFTFESSESQKEEILMTGSLQVSFYLRKQKLSSFESWSILKVA